ncbi:MAG: protein jag [Firmicutes bacterium]|nr:protein jag [Bacillota bacterium]
MSGYEETGKTVDEAVEKALLKLGIKKDNARIEILGEPSSGILGLIGSKEARVKVSPLQTTDQFLKEYLSTLLKLMNISGIVWVDEDEEKLEAEIEGNEVGALIGRRGRTLGDLQYLLNIIVRRQFPGLNKMVVVDVEKYRQRREKTLTQLARSVAKKVSSGGYEQALEPMTPQERRIIHLALQDDLDVTTYSSGQEPFRKVIVAPR